MALFMVKTWMGNKVTPIYGAEWAGTSDPSWVRTDAAVGFSNPNPYYSGMSTAPSSPFDNIMPWSGMRRVTDSNAGELVEIPKFYYKLSQPNGVGLKVQISMSQFDGSYVDPMHMDRGDGVGERDYAYVGRYHCSSSNYKSANGVKPKASVTRATARTNIHNLGSNVWQFDFVARFTLWLLYLVEFANWNSQEVIGYGCGNNSATENSGASDNMPYHTGTMKTSKTTYGVGVQYRYIEGLWDNICDWTDGIYYNANGFNIIKNPSNFSDNTGGTAVGVTSKGYPSEFSVKNIANTFQMFVPTTANGSETTYACDYWDSNASSPAFYAGANASQGQRTGLFFFGSVGVSITNEGIGSRLMVLPPSRLSA